MLLWFRRDDLRKELDEELRAHVAMAVQDRVERGESAQQAERSARLELGNELLIKEVTSDMWGWSRIERLARDMKYTLRQMQRSPGFTAVAMLALSLGLGSATAMFAIVNGVLLEPMKFHDPDRLYLAETIPDPSTKSNGNWPVEGRQFQVWRSRCNSCEQVALVQGSGATLTGAGEPEHLPGLTVSYNFFRTLGVRPARGRDFLPEEETAGRNDEVLIADDLWRGRFASDPNIVGRVIQINGRANTVVGVMPAGLTLPVGHQWGVLFAHPAQPVIFRPSGPDPMDENGEVTFNYVSVVRLKPGVQPRQAIAELNAATADLNRQLGILTDTTLAPLQATVTKDMRPGLWLLLGAVGAVFLIVCVNVGNLMLARSASREREAGIRMALGASRGEMFGLVAMEAGMLAAVSSVLGIFLAFAALKIFVAIAPVELPRIGEIHIDARVLLFALTAAVLAALICGIVPAWRLARTQPQESLKLGTANASADGRRVRFRELLLSAEVALSTVLLIVGGLLMLSFVRVSLIEKGFEVTHVITQDISLNNPKYSPAGTEYSAERARFVDDALRRIEAIPGVDSAGVTSQVPLRGETWIDGLLDPEQPEMPGEQAPMANYRFVSPNYWRAMGIPLKRGRFFDESDRERSVAVISERAAELLWPGQDPIGKHVHLTDGKWPVGEVAGVVGEVRAALEQDAPLTVYEPHWIRPIAAPSFVVRTRTDERAVMGEVRKVLRSMDPELPIAETKTMEQILDESIAVRRFQMYLASGFAAAALALAWLGVYGVISFTVARRTPELGVRIALGARTGTLIAMVLGEGLLYVMAGLVAGVCVALAIGHFLSSELYGVTPHDPSIIGGVAILLMAAAVCACWIPARRAARIDPVRALRFE